MLIFRLRTPPPSEVFMSADLRVQWVGRWLDVASVSDLMNSAHQKQRLLFSWDSFFLFLFLNETRPKVRSCWIIGWAVYSYTYHMGSASI